MTLDAIKSLASNYLFGTVDKACIYVPDIEGLKKYKPTIELMGFNATDFMSALSFMGETAIRLGASASLEMSEAGMGAAGQALRETGATTAEALGTYKMVEVQYNPKSLFISGVGGKVRTYSSVMGVEGENGINQIDNAVSTTLSCELVFSNVNISDAFMTEDLMNFNLEAAAGEVANVAKRLMGMSPSVQPQVDGLMSILTNEYTKFIMFAWGDMIFRGELTRVDANYKMFNKNGDPILATVSINIRQGFDKNAPITEDVWRTKFNKTFKSIV